MAKIIDLNDLKNKSKTCIDNYKLNKNKRTVVICAGSNCISNKSNIIKDLFVKKINEKKINVNIKFVSCFGLCSQGPFVKILPEKTFYRMVKIEDVDKIIENDLINGHICEELLYIEPITKQKIQKQEDISFFNKQNHVAFYGAGTIVPGDIDEAFAFETFKSLERVFLMKPQEVINEILNSGLRGRGGAGFLTGKKMQIVYDQKNDIKYIVCNADEGDPLDRMMIDGNPLNVIEGMLIAGYAAQAQFGYFYIRSEYSLVIENLKKIIQKLNELGLLGKNILNTNFNFNLNVQFGPGSFISGEETALLNVMEGKRGIPRIKPPYPATNGLYGCPTLIDNVETFANIPYIMRNGSKAFTKLGVKNNFGTKALSISGKINNSGLVEVPMNLTLRQLIYEIGGGIPNNKKFKAVQFGGPLGGYLTVDDLDMQINYDNLIVNGNIMGSGNVIVMDEDNCMVNAAKFYITFIVNESCGKCTLCRIGTKRILEILTRITNGYGLLNDLDRLIELSNAIKDGALCNLGRMAANAVLSSLNHFYDEYLYHIKNKKCQAHECKNLIEFSIDADKCKKCSMCARNCPAGAISGVVGKEAFHIDQSKCLKCGTCFSICKFGAVVKK